MVYEESLDIKLMSPGEQCDQITTGWNALTCGAQALGSCLAGWQLLHSASGAGPRAHHSPWHSPLCAEGSVMGWKYMPGSHLAA